MYDRVLLLAIAPKLIPSENSSVFLKVTGMLITRINRFMG